MGNNVPCFFESAFPNIVKVSLTALYLPRCCSPLVVVFPLLGVEMRVLIVLVIFLPRLLCLRNKLEYYLSSRSRYDIIYDVHLCIHGPGHVGDVDHLLRVDCPHGLPVLGQPRRRARHGAALVPRPRPRALCALHLTRHFLLHLGEDLKVAESGCFPYFINQNSSIKFANRQLPRPGICKDSL